MMNIIMMNIKTAKYLKSPLDNPNNENTSIIITIDDETLYVPLDPANRHYQAVLEWEKLDGNTIEEAD